MNYLTVPDSNLKLVDGNVVMLERFPGLKWILHNGWYNYNGRQYSGWYFSSIPSQTILPVSNQDLRMITLVSSKPNDEYPEYPVPPSHGHHGPGPGMCGPSNGHGCDHHHGEPCCPVFPPVAPDPEPEKPAFFSTSCKAQLDAAFISVPTLKKRDQIDTCKLPDGKIVRVNSVNGEPRYYVWSAFNDHWEELNLVLQESLEEQFENYYDKTQMNQFIEQVNGRVDDMNSLLAETKESLQSNIDGVDDHVTQLSDDTKAKFDEVNEEISSIQDDLVSIKEQIASHDWSSDEAFSQVAEKVQHLEEAVFNIQKVSQLLASNTILVSNDGSIADSGIVIGDGNIDEPSEFASDKTLATEKAVVKKVEDAQPKWTSF